MRILDEKATPRNSIKTDNLFKKIKINKETSLLHYYLKLTLDEDKARVLIRFTRVRDPDQTAVSGAKHRDLIEWPRRELEPNCRCLLDKTLVGLKPLSLSNPNCWRLLKPSLDPNHSHFRTQSIDAGDFCRHRHRLRERALQRREKERESLRDV